MNKHEVKERLGRNLRAVRELRGFPRREPAERPGMSVSMIAGIETNQQGAMISTVFKPAPLLEIKVEVLLDGIEWKPDERSEEVRNQAANDRSSGFRATAGRASGAGPTNGSDPRNVSGARTDRIRFGTWR